MLNQAYKLIWNVARGCMVAVSEAAKSRGKSSSSVKKIALVTLTGLMLGAVNANADTTYVTDGTTAITVGSGTPNQTSITIPASGAVNEAYGVYVSAPVLLQITNNSSLQVTVAPSTGDALAGGIYADSVSALGTLANNATINVTATSTDNGASAYGVLVDGAVAGTLSNNGAITVTADATSIFNAEAAAYGIAASGDVAILTNSGAISATATSNSFLVGEASAYGINVAGNVTGTLSNTVAGDITATATATSLAFAEARAYGINVTGNVGEGALLENAAAIAATATSNTLLGGEASAYGINVSGDVNGTLSNLVTGNIASTAITNTVLGGEANAYGINVSGNVTSKNGAALNNAANINASATVDGLGGEASAYGINVSGNADNITNTGAITTTATVGFTDSTPVFVPTGEASAYGINVGGNVLVLDNSAAISATATANEASAYGVTVSGNASDIQNSGAITATAIGVDEANAYGIKVTGDLANLNSALGGVIAATATAAAGDANAYGIKASGNVGVLSNNEQISAAATATTVGDASAYAIKVSGDVTTSLTNTALIMATATANEGDAKAYGIKVSGDVVATIANTGAIAATANGFDEASAYGIKVSGDVTTLLSNDVGGTINATATAAAGDASAYGIKASGNVDALYNNAAINATATATTVGDASAYGIKVSGDIASTLINDAGGNIVATATSNEGDASAYGIKVSGSVAGITNNADIAATATGLNEASAYGIKVSGDVAGVVTNTAGIAALAQATAEDAEAYGIKLSENVGGITNSGTLTVEAYSTSGDASAYGIKVSGGVTDAATGIVTSSNIMAMAGGLEASAYGVYVGEGVAGNIAINAGIVGGQASGSAESSAYGIKVGDSVAGNLNVANGAFLGAAATGSDEAKAYALRVGGDLAGSLTNAGTIVAGAISDSEAKAYGVNVDSTLGISGVALNNTGIITATATATTTPLLGEARAYGVKVGSVNGSVTNSGELSAVASGNEEAKAYALYVSDTLTGNLTNTTTGKILAEATSTDGLAKAYGLKIENLSGNITNNFLIKGTAVSVSGDYLGYSIYAENGTGTITNAATGTLDGAIQLESADISMVNNGLLNTHEFTSLVAGNYTQGASGLLNIDVRSMGITGIGNPLTANQVSAAPDTNYGTVATSYNASKNGMGGLGLYYGGLNVDGTATFAVPTNPLLGAFRVTGYYEPTGPTTGTTALTEAELVKLAKSDTNYLYHVVNAGTLSTGTAAMNQTDVSKLVITDNMMSVQFTPTLVDGSHINFTVTETGMSSIGNAVLANDLSSATGAAGLLDPLMKGPWLGQQNNLAYNFAPGSTDTQKNNYSAVQQYLYYVGNSPNSTIAGNKLQESLPLITGGVSRVTQGGMHNLSNMIQSRQEGQMGISSGDLFYGDKSVWFKPFGSWTNQDKKDGANGFNADTYGMAFGLDGELSENNRLGFAVTYARSDVNGKIADPTAKVDSYLASVYGSHSLNESTEINYQLAGGWNSIDGNRPIVDHTYAAKSSYDSKNVSVGLGVMHTTDLNETTKFIASGRANYTWSKDDAYQETGAYGLNQSVQSNKREELLLLVDGKIMHPLNESVMFSANAGLGYDLIGDRASITSSFIGDIQGFSGINFITEGAKASRFLGRGGLGLTGNVNEKFELTARYDLELRDGYDNQTASLKARWKFD